MLQAGEIAAEEFERTADEVIAHCDDPLACGMLPVIVMRDVGEHGAH
jgi:hypothetical protein